MDTILYVGEIGSPNSAATIHAERVGKLMEVLGYRVIYCCNYVNPSESMQRSEYRYTSALSDHRFFHTLDWLREQYTGRHMKELLAETIRNTDPMCIILYNPSSIRLYQHLLKLCRKRGIGLVIELTEWRDPDWGFHLSLHTYMHLGIAIMNNLRIKFLDQKCGNMIGISQFICDHYRQQGGHVIQLPPLFGEDDFAEKIFRKEEGKPIHLVFAGSLEVKDQLIPLIVAIQRFNSEKVKVTLDLIGPAKKDVLQKYRDELGREFEESPAFIFHGRIPHEKVLELVHKSDFSVLLRENARYAKAGVSTKFSEAACVGTPSICTAVGGTDLFVEDGVNGILIQDNQIETILQALQKIEGLSDAQLNSMKEAALSMGRTNFWDMRYKEALGKFLKELR